MNCPRLNAKVRYNRKMKLHEPMETPQHIKMNCSAIVDMGESAGFRGAGEIRLRVRAKSAQFSLVLTSLTASNIRRDK